MKIALTGEEIDPAALESLREGAKADLVASSLGDAVRLCIEEAGVKDERQEASRQEKSATVAA
jgi:hypothetical protein